MSDIKTYCCLLQLRKRKIFSVNAITQAITAGAATNLQKLRAIWIWLCHNIGWLYNLNRHSVLYS